jgi:hypothetical protein
MENAILQYRLKRRVSIGMFQTSYLSFDVRRTQCVGQTMFSVMTPVSKKIPCKIKMCMKDVQAGVF